jgi:hypothetical protein
LDEKEDDKSMGAKNVGDVIPEKLPGFFGFSFEFGLDNNTSSA